ncbi:MAG: Ppx/GppA phosphatase family protein, partial [Acidimicrobiia bacterium]
LPIYDDRVLLCDIGGGSTEVLLGQRGEVLASRSFRLGAIRLTERFLGREPVKPRHVERCRQHAETILAPFAAELAASGFDVVVGASGTIETVVAMALAARGEDAGMRTLNGQRVTADEVSEVVELLASAPTVEERADLPGMDAKRADILLGGAIILEQLVRCAGIEELVFSDYALREGVLLDQARRRSGATLHHLQDLRRRSVLHLVELTDEHPEHSRETARHALGLFDDLRDVLGLDGPAGEAARPLLEAAALLANVGVFISHSGHHKHSYYVIRNSEHLAGFTDREIELIAQVARYHRKSAPKSKHDEWRALRREDRELVRRLAAVLRVAIGLDRSHGARVASTDVDVDDERVRITLHPAGEAPVDLEAHAADLRSGLLADVLARPVEIAVAPAP